MFNFDFENSLFFSLYLKNFYYWLKMSDVGRLFSASLILLFAVLVRHIFSFFVVKILNFFVIKKIAYGQEKFLREIAKPIEFIPIVCGVYFAITVLKIPSSLVYYTRNLLTSLYIFTITWLIYSFVNPIAFIFRKSHLDNTKMVIITWLVRIAKFLIIIIGLSAFLEKWGVKVSTLIASLGLVGMAVALGAQDMFKNIISGVAIISEHRFNVGDIVKLESTELPIEGIVENIGFRSTMIRKFDRAPLYVPNSILADAAVINFSSRMYRRIEWTINLSYKTSSTQLRYIRQTIEKYLLDSEDFVKPPESILQVRYSQFGPYAIELLIYCFTNTNVFTDWLRIKEDLIFKIREVVEEAGASFAFPSSSVYVEKVDNKLERLDLPKKLKNKLQNQEQKFEENLAVREGDI